MGRKFCFKKQTLAKRMAGKNMFFESDRAVSEIGYRWRRPELGIIEALEYFKENNSL